MLFNKQKREIRKRTEMKDCHSLCQSEADKQKDISLIVTFLHIDPPDCDLLLCKELLFLLKAVNLPY